jgi:hypothetical protein
VLSSESRGPTDDILAAKMGVLSVSLKGSVIIGLGQIRSTCLDSHASEDLVRVSECLVKASSKLSELLVCRPYSTDLFRLHEYIGSAVCPTRGQNNTTTPSTPNSIATPLTSVHHAFPTLNNMCQSSDDSFLGQLIIDLADEAIDTVLLDQSTDTRSGLMNGQLYASMICHAN